MLQFSKLTVIVIFALVGCMSALNILEPRCKHKIGQCCEYQLPLLGDIYSVVNQKLGLDGGVGGQCFPPDHDKSDKWCVMCDGIIQITFY